MTATKAAIVTLTVRVLFSITCFPFILTTVAFVLRTADETSESRGTVLTDSYLRMSQPEPSLVTHPPCFPVRQNSYNVNTSTR